MNQPQCPICHPPQLDIPPPEEGLIPDTCPARGNHEIITRAFEYLRRMEARLSVLPPTAGHPERAAAAQARADIERLRTAHLAVAPTGNDDLP